MNTALVQSEYANTAAACLETVLAGYKDVLKDDAQRYHNHCLRVLVLSAGTFERFQVAPQLLGTILACHDLGLWANDTADYLDPSVELFKKTWANEADFELARLVIYYHHKLTRYRGSFEELVETVRAADLFDVSAGICCGGRFSDVEKTLSKKVPRCGFTTRMVTLSTLWALKNPLNPLPMYTR